MVVSKVKLAMDQINHTKLKKYEMCIKWQINEDEQIVFHFSLSSHVKSSHVTSRDIVLEKCGENKQINESIDRWSLIIKKTVK